MSHKGKLLVQNATATVRNVFSIHWIVTANVLLYSEEAGYNIAPDACQSDGYACREISRSQLPAELPDVSF